MNKADADHNCLSTNKLYGAAVPALTATYSGFVNGNTASSLTTQPALTTTATAASPVGTYPITASGAASPNYTYHLCQRHAGREQAALTITAASTEQALRRGGAGPGRPATAVLSMGTQPAA